MYTFTWEDEHAGYPATKALLKTWTDQRLANEYRDLLREQFDPIFGKNARKALVLVEAEIECRNQEVA